MADFSSGVKGYIKGRFTVEVGFPIDWNDRAEIACKHCPFLASNERKCLLNGEMVAYPHKYVGDHCPLEPIEELEE